MCLAHGAFFERRGDFQVTDVTGWPPRRFCSLCLSPGVPFCRDLGWVREQFLDGHAQIRRDSFRGIDVNPTRVIWIFDSTKRSRIDACSLAECAARDESLKSHASDIVHIALLVDLY